MITQLNDFLGITESNFEDMFVESVHTGEDNMITGS